MNFDLLHPKDQIVEIMARIYAQDMTTTSGGNISVRDENGDVWITPARLDKGRLGREDIVRLAADGSCSGTHPPSSEYPFHLGIYAVRPDIHAIIHAHPGGLVSFSMCGGVPDTRIVPEAHACCGPVAFAPYALPGSDALAEKIAGQFGAPGKPFCVVLENHGVVVGGADLGSVFQRFETLEFTAQTLLNAHQLGAVTSLGDDQLAFARTARLPLPEHAPRVPTSLGKEARKDVCDFVYRACRHRLMTSGCGSFSARIDGDVFVITPHRLDRRELGLGDLVIIREGCRPKGSHPSRAVSLHRAIYQAHPEIHAVVNALPVHATAFSISESRLETRTIPESYLFLKDVPKIPFEQVYGDGRAVAETVGPSNPVALLENSGVLVAGRSVLDAFDRLEVLESTAQALIRSRVLGSIRPMPDAVIQELLDAFPSL